MTGIALAPEPWRYRLKNDFVHESPHLAGITFCNAWVVIEGGRMLIREGYAWDGCTPAMRLPGGVWLGPPDGPVAADGWPQTARASLVHDALCQFRADIPITKAASVAIFRDLLRGAGWPWWRLYSWAVAVFGPQQFAGDTPR